MKRLSRNERETYDELYRRYPGYVVLILKQFMYKGYDESARVLSFIMGYKLYESRLGIAAAGPDKEKIMRYLADYHVNYVISEYGEKTEIRSFEDNRFSRYLSYSQNLPISEEPQEDAPEPVPAKAPSKPARIPCPVWLAPGLRVVHKQYRAGTVSTVNDGDFTSFTVSFDSSEVKKFSFPQAFAQRFLTFADSEG